MGKPLCLLASASAFPFSKSPSHLSHVHMLPRVSPLPEKRDITSYSSLHPHPGHPTIAPSLAEYPPTILPLAQLSGLSITAHFPRPSSRSATDSARPSGYRDVERGLSGSPCQLLRIYENDLVPEPGGPFPPVRSPVTRHGT